MSVSDTVYLAALYRAYESDSPDAIFKDPLAAILAAPKAELLKKTASFKEEARWFTTVRTCLLDEHLLRLVADGVDTVINLAPGLDTRPYRLALPKALHWIEADLPGITEYKTERLKKIEPRCRLDRFVVNLADQPARDRFFTQAELGAKRTLVLTEGLLPQLPEATVAELAATLRDSRTVDHWLMDLTTVSFLERMRDRWKPQAATDDASLRFVPKGGTSYFEGLGWRLEAFDSFLDGSEKIGRKAPAAMSTIADAATSAEDSGVALFRRG